MVISSCDCITAIQVKKEIAQMKEKGFSQMQIFSALQAEYGKQQFEEEYRNFVSEKDKQ